jgi:hypothetical protein
VAGSSISDISGEKTEGCRGSFDYWIIKLDSLANIQWDRTIGGSSTDFFSCMKQTTDGGYILGGYSSSNRSFEKSENSKGGFDYWIVKLNCKGNIEWDKTIGGNSDEILTSLVQTRDGGYFIGGYSISGVSGDKTQPGKGCYDYWVVKLDSHGQILWDKTVGGSSWDYLEAVEQTSDRGYILGGYSYSDSSCDKSANNKGSTDYWIVKLNISGTIIWDKTIGGTGNNILSSIHQNADGSYIAGGSSSSAEIKPDHSSTDFDYWIVKLTSMGEMKWDKAIGGDKDDVLSSLSEVKNNFFIAAGSSTSGKSYDKTQRSRGRNDYWLVELNYDRLNKISSENTSYSSMISEKKFIVYPNPADYLLNVRVPGEGVFVLADQNGKLLLEQKIDHSGSIDVSSLPNGIYYIKNLTTSDVQKILIAR